MTPATSLSKQTPEVQNISQTSAPPRRSSRPHVYELDPLRAVTSLIVVSVHALYFTLYLNNGNPVGLEIQSAALVLAHFTRALFMFVTAFAMVYVYYDRFAAGKGFSFARFWQKRSIGALLPYCIWSIIYALAFTPPTSLAQFARTSVIDILTGNASYQMYYILLTLQFYILLPLFLWLLKKTRAYPWPTLSIGLLLQVLVFYLDYRYIQMGPLLHIPFWYAFSLYHERIIFMYPFYFILGGFTALYFNSVRAFLLKHGKLVLGGMLLGLVVALASFFTLVHLWHEPLARATSVLQPAMVIYSGAITLGFFWLASRWVQKTSHQGQRPRGYHFWHLLSDASFGVYLIHALFLTGILNWLVPMMPQIWPVALRVFLAWFLAAGCSALTSIVLTKIPILSRLVGRAQPLPSWLTITRKDKQASIQ